MRLGTLFVIVLAVPILASLIGWLGDNGISERHHSHHDTYYVATSVTQGLILAMVFMGLMGAIIGWLCMSDAYVAEPEVVLGFFAAFVVVTFLMYLGIRRYRVVTYDDRMDVTPFVGRMVTVSYADVDRISWAVKLSGTVTRSAYVRANGRSVFLWGALDLEQILQRINRFDVMDSQVASH